MTTKNEMLYEKALQAIRELWQDKSVDSQQASDNLDALQDEIQDLINALQSDLEAEV
jgi:hypothetical protein